LRVNLLYQPYTRARDFSQFIVSDSLKPKFPCHASYRPNVRLRFEQHRLAASKDPEPRNIKRNSDLENPLAVAPAHSLRWAFLRGSVRGW
jgi:hypothetical protein